MSVGDWTTSQVPLRIEVRNEGLLAVCFEAMASPCEVLLPENQRSNAMDIGSVVANEAWRVERKFSRYRKDSVISSIHRGRGSRIEVDDETASLIDFAQHCFDISDGMFDITSGVLRAVWHFDQSDRVPPRADIDRLLPLIGFQKLQWRRPVLLVPRDMELDFGGFGKEYAVDRAYEQVAARLSEPFLINFGGDLRANRRPPNGTWKVGIERADAIREASMVLELDRGALATSGDSHRYLTQNDVRFGHILNPRTGWPVVAAPRSVTVAASSCTEAGLLSTLALLKGPDAEAFLSESGVQHWVNR
jgi:FAD:protein FMN transferase